MNNFLWGVTTMHTLDSLKKQRQIDELEQKVDTLKEKQEKSSKREYCPKNHHYNTPGYWFNLPFDIDSNGFIKFLNENKNCIFYFSDEEDAFKIATTYEILNTDMFNRPKSIKIDTKILQVCWDVMLPEELYEQGYEGLCNNCVIFSSLDTDERKETICNTINSIWGIGIWFSHFLEDKPAPNIQEELNKFLFDAFDKIEKEKGENNNGN